MSKDYEIAVIEGRRRLVTDYQPEGYSIDGLRHIVSHLVWRVREAESAVETAREQLAWWQKALQALEKAKTE